MNRASPQIRALAKQLKVFERPADMSADVDIPPVFQVVEKLRPHLSMLMGRSGLQALIARALVLAAAEAPWLSTVRVIADGELEGLAAAMAIITASEFSEGETVLLAQLIGLLVAFIGTALTLRLLNQLWPQLSFNDTDFGNEPSNEEAR